MQKSKCIELLIMRHGQSDADLQDVFEGCMNSPLTEKGKDDARLAAQWLSANYAFDRIICSSLIRARRTAEEVSGLVGVKAEVDRDLRERENGELVGLPKKQAGRWGFKDSYLPHETAPGGETLIAFRARAQTFWSKLMSQSKPGQQILIVSHGQMIEMLFHCFQRLPMDEFVQFKTRKTGIHCWKVAGDSRTVVFSNSLAHLEAGAPHKEGKKSGEHSAAM